MSTPRIAILAILATTLAACATGSTAPTSTASYAPLPREFGETGLRLLEMSRPVPVQPPRSRMLTVDGATWIVDETASTINLTPAVRQPLRPVQLRRLR